MLHPLELVSQARAAGWQVLLDAAAYLPTSPLDVAAVRPDFVCVSFYKMFGYPTGVGCLIARRAAVTGWKREWFSGGNVKLASVAADAFVPATDAAAFEDGTVDFLSLPAVEIGLEHLSTIGIVSDFPTPGGSSSSCGDSSTRRPNPWARTPPARRESERRGARRRCRSRQRSRRR